MADRPLGPHPASPVYGGGVQPAHPGCELAEVQCHADEHPPGTHVPPDETGGMGDPIRSASGTGARIAVSHRRAAGSRGTNGG